MSKQGRGNKKKCAQQTVDQNGKSKLLIWSFILTLSAKFFNFFPPMYTFIKLKNRSSPYSLRFSVIYFQFENHCSHTS